MDNISILLYSNDKNLFKVLNSETNLEIEFFTKQNFNDYFIIIFDNIDEVKMLKILKNINFSNKLIINLGKIFIKNIINLTQPINFNDLIKHINNFKQYFINNCFIIEHNTILNCNKNILTYLNINIELTEKEANIIKTIFNHNNVSKEELLNLACGYDSNIETRTLDTLIYNIKTKLKNQNVNDFIIYENGFYKIKEI